MDIGTKYGIVKESVKWQKRH